ncbi:MAG: UbiD family decarboxylase [Nitrososphaerota archaeon]|nr:UbiD family decarboxylase [Nitrososphaerota archaeon]
MPFEDLRGYLSVLESNQELQRIRSEVDWNLEMCAITRRAMDLRAPRVGCLIELFSNEYLTSLYAAVLLPVIITLSISGSLRLLSKHFEKGNSS